MTGHSHDEASAGATIGYGYALHQLTRALDARAKYQGDPEAMALVKERIEKWSSVIDGLASGRIRPGSRVPTEHPAWATLEVATGGFATGRLLAGGPLQPHERALAHRLGTAAKDAATNDSAVRQSLNAYFLSAEGLGELLAQLRHGTYDVRVPEEGALLVVAWLLRNGHSEAAQKIIDTIAPYFGRLRFYPVPLERARKDSVLVFLETVGELRQALSRLATPDDIVAEREAIGVWIPIYDEAVALLAETVEGTPPWAATAADGAILRDAAGRYTLSGGWPFQRIDAGFGDRVAALLTRVDEARKRSRSSRPLKGSLATLVRALRRWQQGPELLDGRWVGRVRLVLARYHAKRGLVGSATWRANRDRQRRQIAPPLYIDIAKVLDHRLADMPDQEGVVDLASLLASVTLDEETQTGVPRGTCIPAPLERRASRARMDTVDSLIERGVITSGDTLAVLLPQITGTIQATGIASTELRHLYSVLYRAFRRRRSLLLVDLASQVRLEELPWVAELEPLRRDLRAPRVAHQALEELSLLSLRSFPEKILPNKLLQELRALAAVAKVDIPFVDEVAADIFMGTFSAKFLRAAQNAGALLRGTVYERYYDIDYKAVLRIDDARRSRYGAATSKAFDTLCRERAGAAVGRGRPMSVAANGTIIEQQQILTTQNLASLVLGLRLSETLRGDAAHLAGDCLRWILWRLSLAMPEHRARLTRVKNVAYAWRQMVFFLALAPRPEQRVFLRDARAAVESASELGQRLGPALRALSGAVEGHRGPSRGPECLVGWTVGSHWLL